MTPKEKAEELYDKMYGKTPVRDLIIQIEEDKQYAKQCALIAVDEIIDILELNEFTLQEYNDKGTLEYWLHVKDEIEKVTVPTIIFTMENNNNEKNND